MRFSTIIPTYNRAYMVGQAVQSVLSQTLRDFELIVVDDGSDDDTEQVIRGFKDKQLVYHRHQVSQGGSAANLSFCSLRRADGVRSWSWKEK